MLRGRAGEGPSLSGDALPGCQVSQLLRLLAGGSTFTATGDWLPATGQTSSSIHVLFRLEPDAVIYLYFILVL